MVKKNICGTYNCPTDAKLTSVAASAARPHDLKGSSPAQFVLLISHSIECNAVQRVNCVISYYMRGVKDV